MHICHACNVTDMNNTHNVHAISRGSSLAVLLLQGISPKRHPAGGDIPQHRHSTKFHHSYTSTCSKALKGI
jgi:hypothetical protein